MERLPRGRSFPSAVLVANANIPFLWMMGQLWDGSVVGLPLRVFAPVMIVCSSWSYVSAFTKAIRVGAYPRPTEGQLFWWFYE